MAEDSVGIMLGLIQLQNSNLNVKTAEKQFSILESFIAQVVVVK